LALVAVAVAGLLAQQQQEVPEVVAVAVAGLTLQQCFPLGCSLMFSTFQYRMVE
jgi:hypothetical protein